MKEAMAIRRQECGVSITWIWISETPSDKLAVGQFSLLAATVVGMPPFLPEINGHPIYSETERHESTLGKRRRRAVSQPTPMDIDSEEGCQSRCSLCNGSSPSTSWPILQPNIDTFNAKV